MLGDVKIQESEPELSLADKSSLIISNLARLLRAGRSLIISFSGGKDSSVMLDLALKAIDSVVAAGDECPPCTVIHSDTRIENPVIQSHAYKELSRVESFAAKRGLPVSVTLVKPSMSQNWLVALYGGRAIANLPDGGAKCSMQMKVTPMAKAKRRLLQALGEDAITLVGKRTDESASRAVGMRRRGESAVDPVLNEQGQWILSPIMDYTLDDVFEHIGMVRSERWDAYSNWDDLMEVYRAGNGGECELIVQITGKAGSTGCSARFGCHQCLRTKDDQSMENMLKEEQHGYMMGLHRLREYTRKTHYDPGKRAWLSRKLGSDGTLKLSPNAYSPEHSRDLMRFAMTLDVQEQEIADELGIEPRFRMLTEADVIGIAFVQARYGYARALDAIYWYREIWCRGARFEIPDVEEYPRNKLDASEEIVIPGHVTAGLFSGLRDVEAAIADCEQTVEKGAQGRIYSGGPGGEEFTVDEDAAELFFGIEMDRALARYHQPDVAPAAAVHYLLRLGVVEIYKGSHSQLDATLRIANAIHELGLREHLNSPDKIREVLMGRQAAVTDVDAALSRVGAEPGLQGELLFA